MTNSDISLVNDLSEEEYKRYLVMFKELFPKLSSYVYNQANQKASKLPTSSVDVEDLISIGNV